MREHIDTLRDWLNDPLLLLGKLLLDPVLDQLRSVPELLLLPSASTSGLPFHAFIVNERQYAAEQFAVQYAPSATVRMVSRQRKEPKQGAPVLVGISDKSLPGVGRELKQLSGLLPAAVVLADDRATIAGFRAHAPKASAIHLATHGVFREDNPAYSGIKFSDGWLTAADLAEICRDTSLITLSACETGVGSDLGGGEIMGISQAILGSGCLSLISSLWTADDAGTVDLMTDFYGELKRGESAPQAMQAAMLSARQRDDHPYFWAPFAVFGEGKLPTV